MAWLSTGNNHEELINGLVENGVITSDRVLKAMIKVDRGHYSQASSATKYQDKAQHIGFNATISAPHMHAYAAQHILSFLKPGARVLDVGSGSGVLLAVLHHLLHDSAGADPQVESQTKVFGIEHIPELVDWSVDNLKEDGLGKAIEDGSITVIAGDGRLGLPDSGPFDVIHVGAAASSIPEALIEQLARPGRMFIPVGVEVSQVMQVDKDVNGVVTQTPLYERMYVPLTDYVKQISEEA